MTGHTLQKHRCALRFAQELGILSPNETTFIRRVTPYLDTRVNRESKSEVKSVLSAMHQQGLKIAQDDVALCSLSDAEAKAGVRSLRKETKMLCDLSASLAGMYKQRGVKAENIFRSLHAVICG